MRELSGEVMTFHFIIQIDIIVCAQVRYMHFSACTVSEMVNHIQVRWWDYRKQKNTEYSLLEMGDGYREVQYSIPLSLYIFEYFNNV